MSENKIEFRSVAEIKADDDGKYIISGKAICYNEPTILYTDRFGTDYKEMILASALDNVDLSDVPLKYNHAKEKAKILARARQKTLTLENKADGLYFTAELKTNLGEDVYTAIKSGDIVGCSFGFICEADEFDADTNTRVVKKIAKLTDISVVDDAAYKETFVEARSANYFKDIEEQKVKAQNEREKLILLTML